MNMDYGIFKRRNFNQIEMIGAFLFALMMGIVIGNLAGLQIDSYKFLVALGAIFGFVMMFGGSIIGGESTTHG